MDGEEDLEELCPGCVAHCLYYEITHVLFKVVLCHLRACFHDYEIQCKYQYWQQQVLLYCIVLISKDVFF